MKPAYRASWMCRKTLTAESPSGTSNVPTSDPSPLSYSLSGPHTSCETERLWALGYFNLGNCVAPCRSRLSARLPDITGRARRLQAGRGGIESIDSLKSRLNDTVSVPSGRVRGCGLVVGTQDGVGREGREAGNSPGMGGEC